MRSTRRGGRSPIKLKGATELHLLTGCCLIGCEACYGPAGVARSEGKTGYEFYDQARELWRMHRNALLLLWRDPAGKPSGAGFSGEGNRGCGRYFPCFAEVYFDGAPWPKKEKSWPAEVKKIWSHIDDELSYRDLKKKDGKRR